MQGGSRTDVARCRWPDSPTRLLAGLAFAWLALWATPASAQRLASVTAPVTIDGPPAPVPPAVVSRDEKGHVTLRATRLTEPIVLDGHLDDRLYHETGAVSDFIQQEPHQGEIATERTEVWVGYDSDALYIGARLWESDPSKRVTSDMRRDSNNLYNNDHFGVCLDTFYDRRNGFCFTSNAQGGFSDSQVTNEQTDTNWNTIWEVKAANFETGWTIEMRIPLRSIRFRPGSGVWGINFRRMARAKNEVSHLTPIPASYGRRGMARLSSAGTLVGFQVPFRLRSVDIKPYVLGSTITNRTAKPPVSNDGNSEFGVDAKWGLTQSLVADLTYNTDFAQVEDDEQQVNLTRFSLFFPEKRDFFIEGQNVFAFGGAQTNNNANANNTNNITGAPNLTPNLFFSRRIGLDGTTVVPIVAGGRLLGRTGPFQIGALQMHTDEGQSSAAADFSVLRVYRDLLRRSRIGVIATRRAPGSAGKGPENYAYGGDANFTLLDNVQLVGYLARTDTPGRRGRDTSYRGRYEWNADRWGVLVEHLFVGENFNPQVGFLRREAFRRSLGVFRFSPRPSRWRNVRKLYYEVSLDYLTNPQGNLESREAQGAFKLELNSGDSLQVETSRTFEALSKGLTVAKNVTAPVGTYSAQQVGAIYSFGPQRPISGSATVRHGSFYGGTLDELTWKGRLEFSPQFYAEPTISWNRIDLPVGRGNNNLVSSRLTYTLTPRMFVSALVQFQSRTDSLTTNARFRWEYLPGSELFIVYSDGRNTLSRGFPELANRSFIVKVTRLLRY